MSNRRKVKGPRQSRWTLKKGETATLDGIGKGVWVTVRRSPSDGGRRRDGVDAEKRRMRVAGDGSAGRNRRKGGWLVSI